MKYLVHTLFALIAFNQCIAIEALTKQTNWMKFKTENRMSVTELLSNKKLLNLADDDELKLLTKKVDQLGFEHYKYQQFHCGIPVEHAVYSLHTKNNKVHKANGNLALHTKINTPNTPPSLTESVALKKALAFMNAEAYAWENEHFESAYKYLKKDESISFYPKGELVWLDINNYQLSYKFDIYAVKPHSRKLIYIDAANGSVLKSIEKIHSCTPTNVTGVTNYSGEVDFMACKSNNSYTLKNSAVGDVQVFDANSSNATPLNPIIDIDGHFNTDNAATEAYWATHKAKEYFLNTFNRNSLDGEGMPLLSWVHYTNRFNDGANAYWNGSWMFYGDGDNSRYSSFTSPDIVAHEITHGITDFSANLFNIGESGALNESFSDIFGIAFKAHCQLQNDWIIGSDIVIQPNKNGIRNLRNPNDETMMQVQPNTYKGNNWINSMYDNGGVHINSGVQNYWFYLLSEGGEGINDHGNGYNIKGIGLDKAIQIAYRNLNFYLNSDAQYMDARNGAIEAASDLYGENSFEMEQTAAAWCAVGVGTNCDTTTNTILCSYTDSLALVAIYDKLNTNNWDDGWDLSQPMEKWTGVSLNTNRCVIKLEIDGRGISGSIADEIGNLSHLERIDLSENSLTGNIPSSIGNLPILKSIALHYNQLSGEIPSSLSKLYTLESLYLGNNELSGTIPSFYNNYNLKALLLNNNRLQGLISSNVMGSNLEDLNLSNNNLSGTIPEFGNTNLVSINLAHNQLSGFIPTSYSENSKLERIELNDNLLEGELPVEVSNLADLDILWLQNNLLDSCFHPNLQSICEKSGFVMDISNNNFDAAWEDFCDDNLGTCTNQDFCRISDSTNLVVLYNSIKSLDWQLDQPIDTWYGIELNIDGCVKGLHLCDEGYGGRIPPEIGNFSQLEVICLAECFIEGEIPKEIGNLTKLKRLNLNENELSGKIPVEIGNLKYLEYIDLSYNNLTGFIPNEISLLSNLQTIGLSNNDLYGDLSFVKGLKNLKTISLGENNLNGSIPNEINTHLNLETLVLNNNNLTGFLPDDFLENLNITYLNISNNYLQGCYPNSMYPLCDDTYSSISEGNNFTISFNNFCTEDSEEEDFPCEWFGGCKWSDTFTLKKVHESLKGANGYDFWNLDEPIETWRGVELNEHGCVQSISMFEESFDGPLPPEIGNLASLETLVFYDCFINGSIPPEIGNLHSLKELNLQWNELTGEIPKEIGQLFNLKNLVLDGNDLTGAIPTELSALKQLENLDLKNNNLTGSIPPLLSKLPRLESLDLINNNLSGCFHPLLQSFCGQLGPLANISEGNNFVADWVSFCDADAGKCVPPPCQIADSLALISLYLETDGPNWAERKQWNFDEPMATWNGVTLNYEGCVQKIDLSLSSLKGDFPIEVTNMIFLEELDLSTNLLTGNIPVEISNITDLKTLNLAGNELSGAIPQEIANLLKLQFLNLNGNELTGGIPAQFVNLPELENFEVSYNQLSECFPIELILWCDNPNFNEWQISHGNNFPASWSNFCNNLEGGCSQGFDPCRVNDSLSLTALYNSMPVFDWDVSQPINTWSGITLNDAGCVTSIVIDNAAFGTIPPEIGDFNELEILTIINNQDILGEIPNTIGNLFNLKELTISNNGIGGEIPSSLGLLNLDGLDLSNNNLTGPMSWFLTNLHNLSLLSLKNNQLSGCYDDELSFFCEPSRLGPFNSNFEISDGNNFDAAWEDFCNSNLGNCSTNSSCKATDSLSLHAVSNSMPVLWWDNNQPSTWPGVTFNASGCVTNLTIDNAAFGTIPAEIGNFSELEILTITNNPDLLGDIPNTIGDLSNLKELTISNNGISGEIPSSIGLLNLDGLDLSGNNLTGAMPWFLTNLQNLSLLSLKNNQLSGCYDDELSFFCEPSRLGPYNSNSEISDGNNFDANWEDFCNLGSGNCSPNLSCRLTDSLALLAINNSMPVFDWDTSQPINTWSGITLNQSGCVKSIILDDAAFGFIPPEIGNFSALETLIITNNKDVIGDIPDEIGNLFNIKVLDLSNNGISGVIPSSLGLIDDINDLYLNDNNLSGPFPAFLADFKRLGVLTLNNNQLSGCYDEALNFFCEPSQLGPFNSNFDISDGNNFDANWEDFCQAGLGACTPTLPCRGTDSLALLALNNTIFGLDWNLLNPIDTWQGVSLNEQGCVNKLIFGEGLVGTLPEELGNLSKLEELIIKDNGIFGSIPSEIGNLKNLINLEIQNTAMMPDFPSTVKELINLQVLYFENNVRGEALPISVFNIPNLETLYLANNDFTGSIPSQVSNINDLAQLYLNNNQLSGSVPASLANLNGLFALSLHHNQLSGCFDEALLTFCDPSRLGPYNSNSEISNGNLFDSTWEDFCALGSEACITNEVWPGDFDNNGIVDKDDLLYYGLAEGNIGSPRENASTAWFGQPANNWQSSINGINGKHQDADGNGIVNQIDIQTIIDNYGKTTDYQLNNFVASPVKLILEPTKVTQGNGEIILTYEMYAISSLGSYANVHGISGSVDFSKLPVKNAEVDFTNSSLSANRHIFNFNDENGILDIAITKTNKANEIADGSIAKIVIIIDDLPTGDPYQVKVTGGRIMSSNGVLNTVSGSIVDGVMPTNNGLINDLAISIVSTPEQCNSLGSAMVKVLNGVAPFTYNWSTGESTDQINNLYSNDYSVTVTDSNNSVANISFQINGMSFVNNENGIQACENACQNYLITHPIINSGEYKAAKTLNSNGNIKADKVVEFKAGESISLEQGFQIEKGSELIINIRDCE